MKSAYKKSIRFPLIFMDEYIPVNKAERKYFSLIGSYAISKGGDLFLQFIKTSVHEGWDILFQIATKVDISQQLQEEVFQQLIREKKLLVSHGHVMTDLEINNAYSRSICCWNGYRRTTQSGVLPNSFMMGTPVLATPVGSFTEVVTPGKTGEFIDNQNAASIYEGYCKIKTHLAQMSDACREEFLTQFFFANQAEKFKQLLASITQGHP